MKKIITTMMAVALLTGAASAQDASLRDQMVGSYSGSAQGGDYASKSDLSWSALNFTYGEDGYEAVKIEAGASDDQVIIKNLFPKNDNFVDNGLVGTVFANSDYAGYLGWIEVPAQEVGTFKYSDEADAAVVKLYNMDYSWATSEDSLYYWIADDYSLSVGSYATLMYYNEAAQWNYYLFYVWSGLQKEAEPSFRDNLLGEYVGSAQGGDYASKEDLSWSALNFSYGEEGYDAVVLEAGASDDQVIIKNIFPKNDNFVDNGLVGTVVENSDYAGYLGWIEVPAQEVGTFKYSADADAATVKLYNMDYSWATSEDSLYYWIADDYSLSVGSYATLMYYNEAAAWNYYLYYVWSGLQKKGSDSAVRTIAVDEDSNAETAIYSINGLRVDSNNLAPGMYIIRKGNKVSKVLIK